jgi:BirA family biotin operon repressor/biotin-[acetyl-CoA-carboxylase] ligase
MIGNKKVCGILIENQLTGEKISRSIVGIGLNVNQKEFPVATASSVGVMAGEEIDLVTMFDELLKSLEWRYLELRRQETVVSIQEPVASRVDDDYLAAMYWIDEKHTFMVDEREVEGIIRGVNDHGKLMVEIHGAERTFNLKEIKYVG